MNFSMEHGVWVLVSINITRALIKTPLTSDFSHIIVNINIRKQGKFKQISRTLRQRSFIAVEHFKNN